MLPVLGLLRTTNCDLHSLIYQVTPVHRIGIHVIRLANLREACIHANDQESNARREILSFILSTLRTIEPIPGYGSSDHSTLQ